MIPINKILVETDAPFLAPVPVRGRANEPAYITHTVEYVSKMFNLDYSELQSDETNVFLYADPPYQVKDNLYGHKGQMHKGFDHARFADIMDGHLCNVMISYNNHPDIVHRFEEWYQYDFAHTYTMRSTGSYMIDQTKRRELICLNYGKYRSQSVA